MEVIRMQQQEKMRPKKSLGQHFLHDRRVITKIVDSVRAEPDDRVVEVGPGTGALTGPLSRRFRDLHVFEVDRRAVCLLKEQLPGIAVHARSIMEADLRALHPSAAEIPELADKTDDAGLPGTGGKRSRRFVIVGNLPYFLTSPILFRVLDEGMLFNSAVFMVQKEVADRLTALPRTGEYGILSVQAQAMGRIETLFRVSKGAFKPPPSVESAVIRYEPGNETFPRSIEDFPVSLPVFKKVVRTAFGQRRKKISNALKALFTDGFPPGFDASRRAEELTPQQFVELAGWYEQTTEPNR